MGKRKDTRSVRARGSEVRHERERERERAGDETRWAFDFEAAFVVERRARG